MTDQLGSRGRIGIVVPSTNTSCQPESEMLRPPRRHQSRRAYQYHRTAAHQRSGVHGARDVDA